MSRRKSSASEEIHEHESRRNMHVKTRNVKEREEYFARLFVEEALDEIIDDPGFDCASYIKEKMNAQDVGGCGWNCFFVESPFHLSWAIDPYKSIEITVDNYTILIFRMIIKAF